MEEMIGRRVLLGSIGLGSMRLSNPAAANAWPSRPINLLVASAAGGALDANARAMQPKLGDLLGQPIVIENRGGVGGGLAVEIASRYPADGYGLLQAQFGVLVVQPLMGHGLGIDPLNAFVPISLTADVPGVLVVPVDKPWRTVSDLVAAARQKPGALSWGHSGVGATNQLAGALLDSAAQIQTVGVPYRGGGPLAIDLIAGRLDYSFATVASVMTHIREGKLRPLAVPSAQRTPFLPDTPTVAESGFAGFEVSNWYGILAPRGTPRPIVDRINRAIRDALADARTLETFARQGLEPRTSSPEEFAAIIAADRERWAPIVRRSGVTGG